MRAYHVAAPGAAAALSEISRPSPRAGELLVRIEACGLNFADLLILEGQYQEMPEAPFTLGMEVAGTVEATGPGVTTPVPGTRVAVFGGHGGLAEYGCFPAERAVTLPDSMDAVAGAAFQIAYGTSHVALSHRARLAPGERLLVLGAAGGVGLTAVEIGRAMGAEVIACARGAEKLEVARRAGAHHLVPADPETLRDDVRALGGADVVYDPVGGPLFEAAFRACRPEARLLSIGFASGEVPRIKANHLLVKNLTVMGIYWGGYLHFRPGVVRESLAELMRWHGEGHLAPHVSHVLPLERVEEGLTLLRERRSTGKVVIRPR